MSTKKQHLTSGHLLLLILPSMETRWTPTHSEVFTVVSSSALWLSCVKGKAPRCLICFKFFLDLIDIVSWNDHCPLKQYTFFQEGSKNYFEELKNLLIHKVQKIVNRSKVDFFSSLSLILTVARIEWFVGLWPRLPWGQPMSPGVPGLAEVPPRFLITHSELTPPLTQHTGRCQAILRGTTIVINPGHTSQQHCNL